jgi:hypothetical protein
LAVECRITLPSHQRAARVNGAIPKTRELHGVQLFLVRISSSSEEKDFAA